MENRYIKPDKQRIVEINEALKDKSGRECLRLILKYYKEDYGF